MALAPSLLPGYSYRVKPNGGDLAGDIVTIIDNVTFPDTDSRRRRITVSHDGNTIYILPRILEDGPVSGPLGPVGIPASPDLVAAQNGGTLVLDEAPPVTGTPLPPPPPPAPFTMAGPAPVDTLQAVAAATTAATAAAFDHEAVVQLRHSMVANPITDPMDPRLEAFRPKRSKVRKYRNRYMANGMSDVEFLLQYQTDPYRKTNEMRPVNLVLKGDTQSGKTMLVEALAVAWGDYLGMPEAMPIFTLSGSAGITDYDLFGQTTNYTDPETGKSQLVWLPGLVELACQVGGILYLDEMNAMRGNVTSSLHPVIDHRHQFINRQKVVNKDGQLMPEVVTASLDLWVISTLNEGYRDMGLLNEAFSARFEPILWGYSEEVEKQLISSPSLRLFAEALRTARAAKAISTPIGTKNLEMFQLNIATFGVDQAFQNLLGRFQPQERKKVETIFIDRSFKKMLEDEVAQAALNAADDDA